LQVSQAPAQHLLQPPGDGLQESQRPILVDDGGGLEETPLLGGSRSILAAKTACTVAGTCRCWTACPKR
jgi:hypothetical protein